MDVQKLKKINSIIDKIKKNVSQKAGSLGEIDNIVKRINTSISLLSLDSECVKGGSVAKNTFLKGDHDVDLFVRFALIYKNDDLSLMLERILKKSFPKQSISKIHGSRDYYQFRHKKLDYEIIPVLRIHKSCFQESMNITDFSPLHVEWTEKKIAQKPELAAEIKVAKKFCKANNVYGAESYINGFSGHIIDILVIYYGSFLSLIKKFSSIEKNSDSNPIVIDPENALKNPLKELNTSKITSLIIIDPIQRERNAAAALSKEKLLQFSNACKKFLESPSEDFFTIKKFVLERKIKELKLKNKESKIIVIEIMTLEGSRDIVGTKVLKVFEDLKKHLILHDFQVLDDAWHFDFEKKRAVLIYLFNKEKLSQQIEHQGPPLSSRLDVERFNKKYIQTKIIGNRIYTTINRPYLTPEQFLRKFFNESFIKEKIKKIFIKEIL